MAEPFADFTARLSPEARTSLLSSIPMLIASVVGADKVFSGPDDLPENAGPVSLLATMFGLASEENEMSAAADALADASETLGADFRRSPEAQAEFDQLAATARAGGPADFDEKLSFLGEIVGAMPPDLARTYRTFVARTCVSLAMASGGGLFTNPISEVEAAVIRKIVRALRLEITDKIERLLLGMDTPDDEQGELGPRTLLLAEARANALFLLVFRRSERVAASLGGVWHRGGGRRQRAGFSA